MTETRQPVINPIPVTVGRLLLALVVGALGGALFSRFNLPLAWMLGAMVATTVAALSGLKIAVSQTVRAPMVAILGVLLGSAFTPQILSQMTEWSAGVGVLLIYVVVTTGVVYFYFRKLGGFDPTTAYFSSAPGGLNEMIIVGETMGGDARTISLVHGSRVLFVVMTVPFYFRWFGGVDSSGLSRGGLSAGLLNTGLNDILILGACAIIGYTGARILKIRSAQLIGPMILSAVAHLSGLTESRPPFELVATAQVVLGSAIGSRFAGLSLGRVSHVMLLALGSTALMLFFTACLSALAADVVGLRIQALVLALAPGGLAEMGMIALAIGIDTAFVSTMHILRIAVVIMAAPPFFRLLNITNPADKKG